MKVSSSKDKSCEVEKYGDTWNMVRLQMRIKWEKIEKWAPKWENDEALNECNDSGEVCKNCICWWR